MSTQRHQKGGWANAASLERGPSGHALCRRCKTEVSPPRKTFCSTACVHEWKLRTNATYLRQVIFARDRGVCKVCRQDTVQLLKGRAVRSRGTGHLWQADHITPVVQGGGECGIDNIRTLCTACHREATADLAGRRAAARHLRPLITWPNGYHNTFEEGRAIARGCVGPGWSPLIDRLFDELPALGWDGALCQVKEKYARLCFYIGTAPDRVQDRIHEIESLSTEICEDCGAPGTVRNVAGWLRTQCDAHSVQKAS